MAFTLPTHFSYLVSRPPQVFNTLHILAWKLSAKVRSLLFWHQRPKIQHPLLATGVHKLSSDLSFQSRTVKPSMYFPVPASSPSPMQRGNRDSPLSHWGKKCFRTAQELLYLCREQPFWKQCPPSLDNTWRGTTQHSETGSWPHRMGAFFLLFIVVAFTGTGTFLEELSQVLMGELVEIGATLYLSNGTLKKKTPKKHWYAVSGDISKSPVKPVCCPKQKGGEMGTSKSDK